MIINFGDILNDQTGQVMERGEGVHFLILGNSEPNEKEQKIGERYQIIQIGSEGQPMGPINFHSADRLSQLKYVANLPKMLWNI